MAFRTLGNGRLPGQVPSKENLKLIKELNTMPSPHKPGGSVAWKPVLTTSAIVAELGFQPGKLAEWVKFLENQMSAKNAVTFRQGIMARMQEEKLAPEIRRMILHRALKYWRRSVEKGAVQVVSPDEIKKARFKDPESMQKAIGLAVVDGVMLVLEDPLQKGAEGGTYVRRIPKSGGGFTYIYDQNKYNARKDAHLSGEETELNYIKGKITRQVESAGNDGCGLESLRGLVKKYGSKKVGGVLQKCGFKFSKGKLYSAQKEGEKPVSQAKKKVPAKLKNKGKFKMPKVRKTKRGSGLKEKQEE